MNYTAQASALFCCPSCDHETTVYATNEFVRFYTIEFCSDCNRLDKKKYYPELVMVPDEERNLNYVWAHLPEEIAYCEHCMPNMLIHWTELQLLCPVCQQDQMMFKLHSKFKRNTTIGKFKRGWESGVVNQIKK